MRNHTTVCLFCGASTGNDPEYERASSELVALLARSGHRILYGGGSTGIMGAIADAALAEGATVVGVMPGHLVERELAHPRLAELIVTDDINDRKRRMAEMSDAFVALPGGLGTLEEIAEVLSAAQLSLHEKPCAFLNVKGFYDPLIAFMDTAAREGFLRADPADLQMADDNPERLAARLTARLATARQG